MNYGNKAGQTTNYEGTNIANLPPGIYDNFELYDVKADKSTKSDGSTGKNILTFLFTGPEGKAHQHTEWEVEDNDPKAEQKVDNLRTRVGHILHKFVPKEVVDANSATDWASYCAWVMSTLGQSYKGVKLQLKIVGNVYQGKATSGFPGYIPFVKKQSEGGLAFSAKETAANNEYYKTIAAKPDTESAPANAGGVPAGNVDPDF